MQGKRSDEDSRGPKCLEMFDEFSRYLEKRTAKLRHKGGSVNLHWDEGKEMWGGWALCAGWKAYIAGESAEKCEEARRAFVEAVEKE